MAGFADSLDALWAVQKHDAQIVKEQKRIAKASQERAHEQSKVDAAKAKFDAEREKLRHHKTTQKELEDELQRMDARVKQLEAQGTEAATKGAEKQRVKIDELETDGLELLAAIAVQDAAVKLAEAELRAREEALAAVVAATAQVTAAAQASLDKLSALRTAATAAIEPKLLTVYDEVNARHPGNALCHIEGDFCAGCQSNLNTQLLMQVRARREILRCPQCLRILDV
jgi:predicted  nucleic acid-binding Zn-ribbon protein